MKQLKKILRKLRKKVPVYIPILSTNLLVGRTALITGGSSGIGYAIAKSFLLSGCSVIIAARNLNRLESTRERLIEETRVDSGQIIVCVLDLANPERLRRQVDDIYRMHPFDILVNNAGVASHNSYFSTSPSEFDEVMNVNLRGTYFITQEVSRLLIHDGVNGNILFIASSSSTRPATTPYTISKWGIKSLVLGLAKMLIKYGIVVNGIAPGQTATKMISDDESLNNLRSPIERLIAPEEIGNMATIMVSDLCKSVVGDILYMSGGSGLITFDDIDY